MATFDGKFTSVQLGRLTTVYKCLKCYSDVDIEDEMAICEQRSTASAEDQCIRKCEVECIVMNTDM